MPSTDCRPDTAVPEPVNTEKPESIQILFPCARCAEIRKSSRPVPAFQPFLSWRNDGTLVGVMLVHVLALCGRHVVCLVRLLRVLAKMGQVVRHGQRFGQWFDDSFEHILEEMQVVPLHPLDRGLVVRPFVDESPVEMPTGLARDDLPENALRPSVALAEWVEDVEVVVADAQTPYEFFPAEALRRLSPRSTPSE